MKKQIIVKGRYKKELIKYSEKQLRYLLEFDYKSKANKK